MLREVYYNDKKITYNLIRKKVKNINLRIKPDLTVTVSASPYVSIKYIDDFVLRKADFISATLEKFSKINTTSLTPNFEQNEFLKLVDECYNEVYTLFSDKIKIKPTLKLKSMTSRWGSCNYVKNIITLNNNLIYCKKKHIYYIMVHEFSHLIVHNHSADFYKVVEKYCKNYKAIDKELNNIYIKR